MSLISLKFAIFVLVSLFVYFIFPRKYRWTVLLAASWAYYIIICNKYIIYMLVTTVSTWLGGILISKLLKTQEATVKANKAEWSRDERKAYKNKMGKKIKWVMLGVLILNFGILCVLKYLGFVAGIVEGILKPVFHSISLPDPGFLLPLGISFYTFQTMGYIIDVYFEKVEAEKNFFRFALFVSFFPQIIQGPIAMYSDLAGQLYESHDFSFHKIKSGAALIIWGMFKKLVIADRAVTVINLVTADSSAFSGTFILFTALLYALQLYADFSGGIDIVRGIAEMFGIEMAENFKRPYFSKSLTEYWHRWHMTLGNWVRNYVFYPLSISKSFLNMGKKINKMGSKHLAKVVPTSLASLITFLIIGIWHGANGKYVAFGLWNGLVIMLLEIFKPFNDKMFDKLKVKRDGKLFSLASMLWTFILVLVGYYFDIAQNFSDAMSMLFKSVFDLHISDIHNRHLLAASGLTMKDYLLLIVGMLIIFIVSVVQEKTNKQIREMLFAKKEAIQWIVFWIGIFAVAIFGYYGPNVSEATFVYMQF